jgi:hypothetical protein
MRIWTTPKLNELFTIKELPVRLLPDQEIKKIFLQHAEPDDIAVVAIDDDYLDFLAEARERGIIGPILIISPEPIMYEIDLQRFNTLVLDLKKMGSEAVYDIVHHVLFTARHYRVSLSPVLPPPASSDLPVEIKPVGDAIAIRKQLAYLHREEIPVIVAMDIQEHGVPVTARGVCAIKAITDNSIVLNRFKQAIFLQAMKKGSSLKLYHTYRQLNHEATIDIQRTTDTETHASLPDRLFIKKDIRIQPNKRKPVLLHVITPGEPTTACDVIDISTRGIGFVCLRHFPVDCIFSFSIHLPDPDMIILTPGIMRYKKESREGVHYGAEIRPHPWDEEYIAKYVMKREAEIISLLRY